MPPRPQLSRFHPATREELHALPLDVAPRLLGGILTTTIGGERVSVRISEVEAYHGLGTGSVPDPGSHARMGRTARNATMWGAPGHLYVYFSYGMHSCANIVCAPEGQAGGVLLRAGEVVEGTSVAEARRGRTGKELANGPGKLANALGLLHRVHDGLDLIDADGPQDPRAELLIRDRTITRVRSGPRVGVAGAGGSSAFPWRFWIDGDPTVSPFRWGAGAQ